MENRLFNTKTLCVLAMMSALAFILAAFVRVPVVLFLRYDPKDVIIAIAGFLYGPIAAFMVTVVVSLIQMFTVSQTGYFGFIMNVISTCAFACTAAVIYKKSKTLSGAVSGLVCGVVLTTAAMMLWNYIVVPIYMGVPRDVVAGMLLPIFLPFNLIKGGLNAALTLMLYKPLRKALLAARLVPEGGDQPSSAQNWIEEEAQVAATKNQMQEEESKLTTTKNWGLGVYLAAGLVLISCVLVVLVFQGII